MSGFGSGALSAPLLKGDDSASRTEQAQSAFAAGDTEASKLTHAARTAKAPTRTTVPSNVQSHVEPTLAEGRLVKPFVFGGLDGVSTVFAVIAGGIGVKLDASFLLAMGFANVLAGAFSMCVGEYLSSVGEREVTERELSRERWEVENHPEGEICEMIEIYEERGLSAEDANIVARTLAKYEDFWVEHMLLTEIGMLPPDDSNPLHGAVVMFSAFFCFGSLPLVVFGLVHAQFVEMHDERDAMFYGFYAAGVFTFMSLFVLGAVKARLADQSVALGGFMMGMQRSFAGFLAYYAGEHMQDYL